MKINRNKSNNTAGILAIIIVLGIAIPIAWWLLSPLWTTVEVNEALPTGAAAIATEAPAVSNTQAPSTEPAQATQVPAAPAPEMSMLSQGSFYNVAHVGSGQAGIYQLADGSQILRLTDFYVENGPDLYVYLVPIDPVPNAAGSEISGYVSLGPLQGNVGNQNYDIPVGLDLSQFKSVVIWCQAFAVPFSAAPLAFQ